VQPLENCRTENTGEDEAATHPTTCPLVPPIKPLILLSLALLGPVLSTGCASRSKPFPITEVSPGIFEGYKPRQQADFDVLKARGVRTILSLQQEPWDIWPERRHALRHGLHYRDVPIFASPLVPSQKRVKQALLVLNDRSLRPIFVHCLLGKDRNTFIIGLYRVYFQDWKPEAAWEEMLRSGFRARLTLRGFESYFWRHTLKPEWVKAARAREGTEGNRENSDPG
jgi:hypothetical protein